MWWPGRTANGTGGTSPTVSELPVVVLATRNAGKAREFDRLLGAAFEVRSPARWTSPCPRRPERPSPRTPV